MGVFAERSCQSYLEYAKSEMELLYTEFDRDSPC